MPEVIFNALAALGAMVLFSIIVLLLLYAASHTSSYPRTERRKEPRE